MAKTSQKGGVAVLLEQQKSEQRPHAHLATLKLLFEKFGRDLNDRIRSFSATPMSSSFLEVHPSTYKKFLAQKDPSLVVGIFKEKHWDIPALFLAKTQDADILISKMLGEKKQDATAPETQANPEGEGEAEEQKSTPIERSLMEMFCRVVLERFGKMFIPIADASFEIDRFEYNLDITHFIAADAPIYLAEFRIKVGDQEAGFSFLLPERMFDPIRHILADRTLGTRFGQDLLWINHMKKELPNFDMNLSVELDSRFISLNDVLGWNIGSIIPLSTSPESTINLTCENQKILRGKIGNKKGGIAVFVEENLLNPSKIDQLASETSLHTQET